MSKKTSDRDKTSQAPGATMNVEPPETSPAAAAQTLCAPPAAATPSTAPSPPGGNGHDQATLAASPDPGLTLPAGGGLTPTSEPGAGPSQTGGIHSDATLSPADPQTRAYHEAAVAAAPVSINTGASFGHYQLIEPIAKGGMGIVYKARQRNLNRIVAIKMILAGQFADQHDIDRFYAEAEAAAALSHPNIVAIHEIGEVQGQHFFSMDYIDGQSLAALVAKNPLAPRRAAEFVKTIAETMQFAHDSGVVHRDLKPANILLDKKQRPLITDFGLAKQVSNQSQRTMAGSIVGTPSYMPPEQAAGKVDEIGPWSDLYSTGAILYELMTGRPPFRAASPFETIRQVIDTEPLSPRLLNPQVPRDLETICLKCLQKDRHNRYATEQELADELERYLDGKPIHARPISQVARFWRLCKRYPIAASAVAAAVVMLFVALAGTTVGYIQSTRALTVSRESQRMQMKAVNDWFTTVSDNTLLNQPGLQPLRMELYQKALAFYEEFRNQKTHDPRLQDELAAAYFRIAQITEVLQSPDAALTEFETAKRMQQRLLSERPDDIKRLEALGNTVNAMGKVWAEKRNYPNALLAYEDAIRYRTTLAEARRTNTEYQRILANTHMNIGIVEIRSAYAAKDQSFNDWVNKARRHFEIAQKLRQSALENDAKDVRLRGDLGQGYYNLGDLARVDRRVDDAIDSFQKAVAVFEELTAKPPPDLENENKLATSYRMLGTLLFDKGQYDEARREYHKGLNHLRPLAEKNPDVIAYQAQQAGILLNLASLESTTENHVAAGDALRSARDILTRLHERDRAIPRYQRDLAVTLRELALNEGSSPTETGVENLRESMRLLADLVERYPADSEYDLQLEKTKEFTAEALRDLAVKQATDGDATAAKKSRENALALMEELVKKVPEDAGYAEKLKELKSFKLPAAPQ